MPKTHMSDFLHDVSNILAVIQGKLRAASRLAQTLGEGDFSAYEPLSARLEEMLREVERMADCLAKEKREKG